MTEVESCGRDRCKHNVDGKCTLDKIHLIESYGRSTDYIHVFMCKEEEQW